MVADMELFFRFVQKEALFSIQILFVVDWNRFLDSLDINMREWLESSSVQFGATQRQNAERVPRRRR